MLVADVVASSFTHSPFALPIFTPSSRCVGADSGASRKASRAATNLSAASAFSRPTSTSSVVRIHPFELQSQALLDITFSSLCPFPCPSLPTATEGSSAATEVAVPRLPLTVPSPVLTTDASAPSQGGDAASAALELPPRPPSSCLVTSALVVPPGSADKGAPLL